MLGAKANFDIFYKNVYMARAGGVPLQEMNALELALLVALNYSTTPVSPGELESLLVTIPAMVAADASADTIGQQFLAAAAPVVDAPPKSAAGTTGVGRSPERIEHGP